MAKFWLVRFPIGIPLPGKDPGAPLSMNRSVSHRTPGSFTRRLMTAFKTP
ncbi:MAG TPA: hypothetical protein PKG82_07620 [Myxococcota bacterium]|nr:hypothetical protein [Myxococcota bacterium]